MQHALAILALLTIGSFSFASAQTPKASPKPTASAKRCEPQLARLLVDQLASDSKSIPETDKRVNVLIKVADFLWVPDVESARSLFAEAFQVARDRFKEKGFEQTTEKGGMIRLQPDYRFLVIRAVARRDAKWARQLTEIVLKDKQDEAEEAKRKPFNEGREVSEILQIAMAMLDSDQAGAMAYLRRAMQYPLDQSWIYALHTGFEKKGAAFSDPLYLELLNNYANADPSRLMALSLYPFAAQRMIGLGKSNLSTSIPPGLTPNPGLQKQFLTIFIRRVISLSPEIAVKTSIENIPEAAYAYSGLNEIEPLIAAQFPELAEIFNQARANAISLMTDSSRDAVASSDRRNKETMRPFDEKIAALEEAEEKGKLTDYMIAGLIMGLRDDSQFEALEPWLDKIAEEIPRDQSKAYFYFTRSKLATKESRFEDARKYADRIEKIEHRAVLYFDIAQARMKDPSTKLDSLDSLNEVYKMALKAPDTVEKAQVFLGLAFVYEGIDHANALDSVANAARVAGKLTGPNLFTSNVTQQIIGKGYAMFASYNVPGFDVNRTFYELSKKDFQGALTQAEGFTDKHLRTLAVLAVVRDCEKDLKPQPKPKTKPAN